MYTDDERIQWEQARERRKQEGQEVGLVDHYELRAMALPSG